ncbi:MAG: hypothetical protein ACT4OD_06635, partial [Candidatus Nitrosotenuis sp.]
MLKKFQNINLTKISKLNKKLKSSIKSPQRKDSEKISKVESQNISVKPIQKETKSGDKSIQDTAKIQSVKKPTLSLDASPSFGVKIKKMFESKPKNKKSKLVF